MTVEGMPTGEDWKDNRTFVIAWLLVFFPVGLYGLWKGNCFDSNWKVGLTVLVVVVFLVMGMRLVHPAYVFLFYPAALFVLWQDKGVKRATFYKFAGGWAVVFVLFVMNGLAGPASYQDLYEEGGSCAAVMTQNNCTYYRDSDCNVIARECS